MKIKHLILFSVVISMGYTGVIAQVRPVFPEPKRTPEQQAKWNATPQWYPSSQLRTAVVLPKSVNNSASIYFPPICDQGANNSCAQSSGIRHMFTYEMNRLLKRAVNNDPKNIFSYHYTWNFLNGGNNEGGFPSDGIELLKVNGAMSLADFPDEGSDATKTKWATGYDKYYRAMSYRSVGYQKIGMKTQEGIDRVKRYLYDKGENQVPGGVVTFSCLSGNWSAVEYTGTSEAGIKYYIKKIGTDGAHALTIVGYDDTAEFDLNNDKVITEDEKGAFIFANSWGSWWGDNGRAYYPYKWFLAPENEGGLKASDAEACCIQVKYEEPKIVFKINLSYNSRNDLRFKMGVADGYSAPAPIYEETSRTMNHQGGDYNMQGNNKNITYNTLEMAFNFSDQAEKMSSFSAPKYFLEVRQTVNGEKGSGVIHSFTVYDYRAGKDNPKIYTSSNQNIPITADTKLSIATIDDRKEVKTSANKVRWTTSDMKPKDKSLLIKGADGKYYKLIFDAYNQTTGRVVMRYQPFVKK